MDVDGFSYTFPPNSKDRTGDFIFAVSPSDPRYYLDKKLDYNEDDANNFDLTNTQSEDGIPTNKLKAPMEVKPMSTKSRDVNMRDDLKTLYDDLHAKGHEGVIVNREHLQFPKNDVVKKHIEMDAAVGMYVVALIAGISAAVTVGLIAIGIGWYT